ncbi:hypothetical protein [uncultured Cellulomonas sp.]|uniref:hypothetical protein n=1 Tax=uncultured Cellulomonas sp. TaxID=189682 RepID=UPI0028E90464|nr:hypothetical protein [uncultured Cellulomonas sp.]
MIPALLAATPSPSPSPSDVSIDGTPLGSPGFLGFVFTFALAIAVVFLFLSLTKQLRVVDRRAKALGLDDDSPTDPGLVDTGAAGPDLEVGPVPDGDRPDGDRPGGTRP